MSENAELIPVQVTVSVRTAHGAPVAETIVGMNISASMVSTAESCQHLVLVQPANERGSYSVYAGAKNGIMSGYIGSFWAKSGEREARFDFSNVAISAVKNESGVGYKAVKNAKTQTDVYQYTSVNTNPKIPMPNVILSMKKFVGAVIVGSKLIADRTIEVGEVSVGSVDDVVHVAVAQQTIPNPLESAVVVQ